MVLGCAVKLTVSANLNGSRSEQDTVYCGAWQRVFGAGRFSERRESVLSCVCLLSLFLQQPQAAWKAGESTALAVEEVALGSALPKRGGHKQLVAKEGLATPLKMMVLLITDLSRPGLLWSVRIAAGMGGGSHFPAWSSLLMEKE